MARICDSEFENLSNQIFVDGGLVDFSDRPSLSDLGWTRRSQCVAFGSSGYSPGQTCEYVTGGDAIAGNDKSGGTALWPNQDTTRWYDGVQSGLTRTILLASDTESDTRSYVSWELDTTGMPADMGVALNFNTAPRSLVQPPPRFFWSISGRDGDFGPDLPSNATSNVTGTLGFLGGSSPRFKAANNTNSYFKNGFVLQPNKTYYFNLVAVSNTTEYGSQMADFQPVPALTSDYGILVVWRRG